MSCELYALRQQVANLERRLNEIYGPSPYSLAGITRRPGQMPQSPMESWRRGMEDAEKAVVHFIGRTKMELPERARVEQAAKAIRIARVRGPWPERNPSASTDTSIPDEP